MADDLKRVGLAFTTKGEVDFKKTMAEVNAAVKENYSAYRLAQSEWDKSTKAQDKLKTKQEYLTKQTETYSDKVKVLKMKIEELEKAEERDGAAIEKTKTQLNNAQATLNKYEKELEEVNKDLKYNISSMKEFAGKLDDVGEKCTESGKKLTSTVTVGVTALGTAAVKTAADFDEAMSNVSAISGATGEDLDALKEKAREMGSKTKFSAKESADAMGYMAMAGWKTKDMVDGIEGVMSLAAASGEDLATTSDIVTDSLTGFGKGAEESGKLADIMAVASSNANTNVSMMGETFKYVASVAGGYGYSMEETAEMTALLANAGIKGSQAGTGLRAIMSRLATDAGASSKSLGALGTLTEKLGVQFYNADGTMRPFRDVINDTRDAWGNLTQEEQANYSKKIAGLNAQSAWLALMQASEEDVNKLETALSNCDGTAGNMADTMNDNLAGQFTILKSQLEELAISFGEILMPVIRDIVSNIQGFVDKLNGMSESQRKVILVIAAVAAAIGPLLIGIGTLCSSISSIITIVSTLAPIIGGLSLKFIAIPVIIAAVIAAGVWLYKNWDTVKEKASQLKDWVVGVFNSLKENVSAAIQAFADKFPAAFAFISNVFAAWKGTISNYIEGIKQVFQGIIQFFKGVFTGNWKQALEGLKSIFSGALQSMSALAMAPLNALKGVISGAWEAIDTMTGGKLTEIKNKASEAWANIKKTASETWKNVKETAGTLMQAAKDTISEKLGNIKSAYKENGGGIKGIVSASMEAVKGYYTAGYTFIDKLTGGKLSSIKNSITGKLKEAKDSVSGILDNIKKAFSDKLDSAKNTVKNAIDKIKGFFNFSWSLPKLKMPHFKIDGKLSLNPPSVPKFSVDWYAKGGILNRPTIFGQSGGKLLGGGEAGPEAVLPISLLKEYIDASNEENNERLLSAMEDMANRIMSILQKYLPYLEQGTEIRLDSGALVGAIAQEMDVALGRIAMRNRR